jgi:hypothetical protein
VVVQNCKFGLVLFTFDISVAVKSVPFKVIAGVVRTVFAVMFGAVIFPINDCAVVVDKLALSINIVAKSDPFKYITGTYGPNIGKSYKNVTIILCACRVCDLGKLALPIMKQISATADK